MVKVAFQLYTGQDLGQTKVFQTKSSGNLEIDQIVYQDVSYARPSEGFVQFEMLLSDTETVGSTAGSALSTIGWIKFDDQPFVYTFEKATTYNTNGGKVFVIATVIAKFIDYNW